MEVTLPKAPELIKILDAVASDVFYDSSNDYEPIAFDPTTIDQIYGNQFFFDVVNQKNMIVTNAAIGEPCLTKVENFINFGD